MSEAAANPNPERDLIPAIDRAEASLKALAADAGDAARGQLMGILAAAIAHEVRNIVTPIQSSAEMALENLEDHELVKRSLQRAVAGARRVGAVVEAVMDCAAGRVCGTGNRCEVEAALEGAMGVLGEDWERNGVRIERRIEAGCSVGMSRVCLEQVLINLLLNAAAAMGRRSGTVYVRACTCWNNLSGPRVVVEVEDEGRGIEPGNVSMVFDAFVSGAGQRGKGLGLTICRHLVEAAGGSLTARSTVDVGTTFVIDLPVGERAAERKAG